MSYRGRRAYQEMAHARGRLNAIRQTSLSADEIAAIDRESAAAVDAARAKFEAEIARVHHLAIKAPEHKCFRVVRRWKDEEYGEDIGFFRTSVEACRLMNRELAWAIVIDPNGKRSAHNFQPMTHRPVERG